MDRIQKQDSVLQIAEHYKAYEFCYFVDFTGVTVAQVSKLRRELLSSNSAAKVVKNTLSSIAAKNSNVEHALQYHSGQILSIFSNDLLSSSKAIKEFLKSSNNSKFVGMCDKKTVYNESYFNAVATLPPLDELRSKFLSVLQGPQSKLVRILDAYTNKLSQA